MPSLVSPSPAAPRPSSSCCCLRPPPSPRSHGHGEPGLRAPGRLCLGGRAHGTGGPPAALAGALPEVGVPGLLRPSLRLASRGRRLRDRASMSLPRSAGVVIIGGGVVG